MMFGPLPKITTCPDAALIKTYDLCSWSDATWSLVQVMTPTAMYFMNRTMRHTCFETMARRPLYSLVNMTNTTNMCSDIYKWPLWKTLKDILYYHMPGRPVTLTTFVARYIVPEIITINQMIVILCQWYYDNILW